MCFQINTEWLSRGTLLIARHFIAHVVLNWRDTDQNIVKRRIILNVFRAEFKHGIAQIKKVGTYHISFTCKLCYYHVVL